MNTIGITNSNGNSGTLGVEVGELVEERDGDDCDVPAEPKA